MVVIVLKNTHQIVSGKQNTSEYGLNLIKHKYSSLKDNLCKKEKEHSKRRMYGTECK